MRICLAASGGGHVRQLLDLEPVWSRHDRFFVTEPTALGQSLARDQRVHFIPHVAIGQARLGRPLTMIAAAWRNLVRSFAIVRAERPDVVISTGAGAVFFTLLWARLFGARIIAIESFARFDRPSLFMRIAAPIAHDKVVQSKALSGWWPGAKVFDPLRLIDTPPPPKEQLLFVTVGATLPFDRMISSVASLVRSGFIDHRVIAQVGIGGVRPEGLTCVETMPVAEMVDTCRRADVVVCHGGTGSLITALREHCRTVAMPRRFALGEHYDDHQTEITSAFEQRGLVRCARDEDELRTALSDLSGWPPVSATTDPQALIGWLNEMLGEVAISRSRGR